MSVILNPIKCYLLARLKDDKKRRKQKLLVECGLLLLGWFISLPPKQSRAQPNPIYDVYRTYDITVNSARIIQISWAFWFSLFFFKAPGLVSKSSSSFLVSSPLYIWLELFMTGLYTPSRRIFKTMSAPFSFLFFFSLQIANPHRTRLELRRMSF